MRSDFVASRPSIPQILQPPPPGPLKSMLRWMNSRNQGDTEEKTLPAAPTAHMLRRWALVHPGPTSDESFLWEALAHFSQFNKKHQKTCPAWKLHNNKSQARRKYCTRPWCTNPIEFGFALFSLLDCQSCAFLPSCWYDFDLLYQIQLSLSSPPPTHLQKYLKTKRDLSNI